MVRFTGFRTPRSRTNLVGEPNERAWFKPEVVCRSCVGSIHQVEKSHGKAFCGVTPSELGDPFAGASRSLSSLLRNSTIGVAFFDRNLRCKAFNAALRSMVGASAKKHICKKLHQLFRGGPKLELAFLRVWNSGNFLSNACRHATASLAGELLSH
jgi:PAS domain-containing protein